MKTYSYKPFDINTYKDNNDRQCNLVADTLKYHFNSEFRFNTDKYDIDLVRHNVVSGSCQQCIEIEQSYTNYFTGTTINFLERKVKYIKENNFMCYVSPDRNKLAITSMESISHFITEQHLILLKKYGVDDPAYVIPLDIFNILPVPEEIVNKYFPIIDYKKLKSDSWKKLMRNLNQK